MIRSTLVAVLGMAMALAAFSLQAGSFAGSTAGSSAGGSSATSGSSSGDDKVVIRARDDAAGFVASDGRIRTARLEAALRHLREHDATARDASDLQLARAILAR
ncbi:MAG: DUF2388 domain-containing protein [Luteimonas sp.]|nr:DUF2388 domain-containing protein [Luteimonas sp.]